MPHELFATWRDAALASAPYLLPGDDGLLGQHHERRHTLTISSWSEYVTRADFGAGGSGALHLGLCPVPFIGDPERAKVVILLLNPGLAPTDYFGEYEVPGFRERVIANARRVTTEDPFPFFYLDPSLAWHGGFDWWNSKLRGVITALARSWGLTFSQARQRIAREIAAVELVPYHSENYSLPVSLRDRLTSTKLARCYVADVLAPKAKRGEVTLIVTRHAAAWGLKETEKVVVYQGAESRAAHLTPDSRGGAAIVSALAK